jgi:hypothetical protein
MRPSDHTGGVRDLGRVSWQRTHRRGIAVRSSVPQREGASQSGARDAGRPRRHLPRRRRAYPAHSLASTRTESFRSWHGMLVGVSRLAKEADTGRRGTRLAKQKHGCLSPRSLCLAASLLPAQPPLYRRRVSQALRRPIRARSFRGTFGLPMVNGVCHATISAIIESSKRHQARRLHGCF